MMYVVERLNHEADNEKPSFRYYTTIKAAWTFMTLIRDIWPKSEAWLWETNELNEEIFLNKLIAHLNAKED